MNSAPSKHCPCPYFLPITVALYSNNECWSALITDLAMSAENFRVRNLFHYHLHNSSFLVKLTFYCITLFGEKLYHVCGVYRFKSYAFMRSDYLLTSLFHAIMSRVYTAPSMAQCIAMVQVTWTTRPNFQSHCFDQLSFSNWWDFGALCRLYYFGSHLDFARLLCVRSYLSLCDFLSFFRLLRIKVTNNGLNPGGLMNYMWNFVWLTAPVRVQISEKAQVSDILDVISATDPDSSRFWYGIESK